MKKLYVVFLWHMHQPLYKDHLTSHYYLPWVRLHATKGYWDMMRVIEAHPKAKAVINLTPSLLYQLKDISERQIKDKHRELSLKAANKLTKSDKEYLLSNFFMINWETNVLVSKRYGELLEKRGKHTGREIVSKVVDRFNTRDYRDLQVHYNLAWCGFSLAEEDKLIKKLKQKDSSFTEGDKRHLIAKQEEIISKIIPSYKRLQDKGRIEIATTPFYHPILPLLCNGSVKQGFNYIKDAEAQINKSVNLYTSLFGCKPSGFWPAEGAVSNEALMLFKKAGAQWIATDEEILMESLQDPKIDRGSVVYKFFESKKVPGLTIFFRDKNLSNAISFYYSQIEQSKAVADFIRHIRNIRDWVQRFEGEHIVTVALDGENSWEYFIDGGREFLHGIYGLLPQEEAIELTTFKEILTKRPKLSGALERIYPGSWINHNFNIWIGSGEDNKAWELLGKTREMLVKNAPTNEKAWEEIYAAEGSDWFWWYGDDFTSENDYVFDNLFRMHLMNVYKILGKRIPAYLEEPIRVLDKGKPAREVTRAFMPNINGYVDSFYEWEMAGLYNVNEKGSTMFGRESIVKSFYYGYDIGNLYVRIDMNINLLDEEGKRTAIVLEILSPSHVYVSMPLDKNEKGKIEVFDENDMIIGQKYFNTYAFNEVIECAIPFRELKTRAGEELKFVILVNVDGVRCESWPKKRFISIKVPTKETILQEWNL
jgi:alpha-amylase/alpha-mannosidase (GH57 family)